MLKLRYYNPVKLAVLNLLLIFIIGLIFKRKEIELIDWVSIVMGGFFSSIFIIFLILTHKIKELKVKPEQVQSLITEGLFKHVRHPVYAGVIFMNIAIALFFRTIILVPFITVFILIWYYQAKHEEELLRKKFGRRYENYMKKTGMFLPKKEGLWG